MNAEQSPYKLTHQKSKQKYKHLIKIINESFQYTNKDKAMSMQQRIENEINRVSWSDKEYGLQRKIINDNNKSQRIKQQSDYEGVNINNNGSIQFTIKPLRYQQNTKAVNSISIHSLPYQFQPQSYQSHYISNINYIPPFNHVNNSQSTFHYQNKNYHSPMHSNLSNNFSSVKSYVYPQPQITSLNQTKYIIKPKQMADDEQCQKPLTNRGKNKIKMNNLQKSTLINEDQIKKGFNNSLQIALNKVNKMQQEQLKFSQQASSIQIVSNLVHETYSPENLRKNLSSSQKRKKKKRIFESTQQKRLKAFSLYEQSNISFGTPQSMKMRNNNLQQSILQYEMKTEKQEQQKVVGMNLNKDLVRDNKWVYEQEFPKSLIPSHILSSWQRIKANSKR